MHCWNMRKALETPCVLDLSVVIGALNLILVPGSMAAVPDASLSQTPLSSRKNFDFRQSGLFRVGVAVYIESSPAASAALPQDREAEAIVADQIGGGGGSTAPGP